MKDKPSVIMQNGQIFKEAPKRAFLSLTIPGIGVVRTRVLAWEEVRLNVRRYIAQGYGVKIVPVVDDYE